MHRDGSLAYLPESVVAPAKLSSVVVQSDEYRKGWKLGWAEGWKYVKGQCSYPPIAPHSNPRRAVRCREQ